MRLTIGAVGRMRDPHERALFDTYRARASALGRGMGVSDIAVAEVEPGPSAAREAEALLGALRPQSLVVALDEGGKTCTSARFAARLEQWKDAGPRDIAFLIGGAGGHGPAVRAAARETLSLGAMTWPHMLARIMLMEQIYRGLSIIAGHPYHRG